MATSSIAHQDRTERSQTISVKRLAAAGGMTTGAIFVLCWIGTFIPFSSPTHAFIRLFTLAYATSIEALLTGTFWALLFGALSGGLFALAYNATAPLARR